MRPYTDAGTSSFLEAVDAIGERLSREAVWHQGRCNWMGVEPVGQGRTPGEPGMAYKALGPELYSGTSGVALFLAELHAVTGDVAARCTALGGLRHALSYVDAVPPLV